VHAEDRSFFSLWLKETYVLLLVFVVGSLHITSHIGHVGAHYERSGLCLCHKEKSASGNIYTHIFLKSTKCCKL